MSADPSAASRPGLPTHEVLNQAGEPPEHDAYRGDRALAEAVSVFGADWAEAKLAASGARVGSAEIRALARDANRNPPELRTHDRFGNRIDAIDYHPAWHALMGMIRGAETHSLAWTESRPGAQVARGALAYLWAQGEPGIGCPQAMTFASVAALGHAPDLFNRYRAGIFSPGYDPRPLPPAEKSALTVAMAMTEKQGGSDLRQTMTEARPFGGGRFALTGHKWFFSVPASDLILTLARTDAGVTCFLAPGWREDGSRNGLALQRLKDKCGNRSNASSEVEFRDLEAEMVGAEGRGIATIIEMAHLTRLECALGSAALMRQAVSLATFHASRRHAFQRALIDQTIMRAVIADMALDAEAALWLAMRAAAAVDGAYRDPREAALARIVVPVAKYWICKRAPALVAEALECHGGNGFIEENPIARLYREAPLNGVWEGAGNVICLDVIRALARTEGAADALLAEFSGLGGEDAALDAALGGIREALSHPGALEAQARRIVERMAMTLAAALLLRHAPGPVAGGFIRARLANPGLAYGTLTADIDTDAILDRASVIPAP